MSKKHKHKKILEKRQTGNFIDCHWNKIVVAVLVLLSFLYFSPFLDTNKMLAGSDYVATHYPLKKWMAEQDQIPLWYTHIFSGVPILGSPVGGPLAPTEQLREIMPLHIVLPVSFILMFFLAGLGTFLYLKEIGLSKYSAAVGAVIYQFIGNLATTPMAGHLGRAASIALFPLMIFFVHRGMTSRKLLHFVFFALTTAFAFFEGHFQITYYALLFILCYVIYYLITHRKKFGGRNILRVIGYGMCSVILICLLMAIVWLPVLGGLGAAARGVERGYEYATSWSMSPYEIIDLAIPTYSGILDNYWGFNSFKLHLEYFGISAFIFAIMSVILFWKKQYAKFYLIAVIVVILSALGGYTPFFKILYTIIPGFKLTRAPALIFYLASFGFIVLAGIGFENLVIAKIEQKTEEILRRRILTIFSIIIGILLIVGIICSAGQDSIVRSMQDSLRPQLTALWGSGAAEAKITNIRENFPEFITGIWRSLVFAAIICALILVSLKRKFHKWIFVVIVIAITLIDQLPFVGKYLPEGRAPRIYYAADNVVNYLRKDQTLYRVFPTPRPWYNHSSDSYLVYHNIQTAGGLIANPTRRYQEFIGAGTSVMFTPFNLLQHPKFVDMLNAKYVIGPTIPDDISGYSPQNQMAIRQVMNYFAPYKLVSVGQQYSVFLNENVLPRAYIVYDYRVLSEHEILDYMKSEQFNPRHTVILEEDPGLLLSESEYPLIAARVLEYRANEVVVSCDSPQPGFLVLCDNWHPDWKVFIDGEKHRLYQANYTFRAVYVPAGEHEVVFKYISEYFNIGSFISIVALICSVGLCILLNVKGLSRKSDHCP